MIRYLIISFLLSGLILWAPTFSWAKATVEIPQSNEMCCKSGSGMKCHAKNSKQKSSEKPKDCKKKCSDCIIHCTPAFFKLLETKKEKIQFSLFKTIEKSEFHYIALMPQRMGIDFWQPPRTV